MRRRRCVLAFVSATLACAGCAVTSVSVSPRPTADFPVAWDAAIGQPVPAASFQPPAPVPPVSQTGFVTSAIIVPLPTPQPGAPAASDSTPAPPPEAAGLPPMASSEAVRVSESAPLPAASLQSARSVPLWGSCTADIQCAAERSRCVDGKCVRGGRGYHLHDEVFLRAGGLLLVGLLPRSDSPGAPVGGGQIDLGYAPLPGLIPFFSLFLGGSAESFSTGGNSELSFTHFYFNPALGLLVYPDPKRGVSLGARAGYMSDQVTTGNLTVNTTGYQVNGELGFGFWAGDNLELSFRGMLGFFHVAGSGSASTSNSFSSATLSRGGPYGGLFVALTFN